MDAHAGSSRGGLTTNGSGIAGRSPEPSTAISKAGVGTPCSMNRFLLSTLSEGEPLVSALDFPVVVLAGIEQPLELYSFANVPMTLKQMSVPSGT
ncbi:MAG: hypothetical protein R3F11_18595 [Verrucomicrobiales bacterium]